MRTRHRIVTGITTGLGLTLVACGCGLETQADQRLRQRFEVTPAGVTPAHADRDALASRRPRPEVDAVAEGDELGAASPTTPPVPSAEAVRRRIQASGKALQAARSAATAAEGDPAAAPPVGPPPVKWSNPDTSAVSDAPRLPAAPMSAARFAPTVPTAPAVLTSPLAPVVPTVEEAKGPPAAVDADPSAANQATQIVRPVAVMPAPPPAAIPAGTTVLATNHEPLTVTASVDPDPLGHKVAQQMRDYPSDLSAHLDYQMLRFLRDEPVPQLDTVSPLPGEDRELLTALLDGLSNFRSGLRADKNMLLSQKVKPILDLADRVRSQAELTIPTIAVCSRVQGFGVYDPMPSNLKAGADNPLIIYCEVQNFSSQPNDKGMWETKLSQEAVLYTETGLNVWHDKSDIPADLSRNRRHDFFVVKKVMLPRTLGVGRYVLKVTIVDEQVKRVAENSIPLQVLAQ